MASQIVSLYEVLKATSLTVGSDAVRVKGLGEIPSALTSADLPMRLLTPISQFLPQNAQSGVWAGVGSSVVTQITWNIADVMYLRSLGQGVGIRTASDDLVAYMRDYVEMARGIVMPNAGSTMWITNVALQSTVLEYPILSDKYYYAVVASLTVVEKM